MQVTRPTFIPLLASAHSDRMDPNAVREEYCGDLTVVYTFGPQFGRRVVTHADLEQLKLPPRILQRSALEHLEVLSSRAEFHGQPPALMLSFEGLESSLLFATDFWTRLKGAVPGELVVGVPARDVVIVTGSDSGPGLEKARRCVERVFFAGDEHLLSRSLLVRRGATWEPFDRPARQGGRPGFGLAHQHGHVQPPRQYQEHPSWPGERVPLHQTNPGLRMGPAGPAHRPMRVGQPMAQAAHAAGPHVPRHPNGLPPAAMPSLPHPRTGSGPVGYSPEVAEVAQYSAVPYSAMPFSAAPYSAAPYSAAPNSAVPYSAAPYSAAPYSGAPYAAAHNAAPHSAPPYVQPVRQRGPQDDPPPRAYAEPKPAYRDDLYSTSSHPRALYPDYEAARATPVAHHEPETPQPVYPASWGSAPDTSASRTDFSSGPRARFAR